MNYYAFSFDVSRCSGCMACVVACQDQNDSTEHETAAFRHVTIYEEGDYPTASISYLSLSCQHCGDGPCIQACPAGAISRIEKDGTVVVNRDLCIGCHSCELVCPFGAPTFLEDGKMSKCDLCYTRREHNMEPACVRACPARALSVGPVEELAKQKAEKASIVILKSLACAPPKV